MSNNYTYTFRNDKVFALLPDDIRLLLIHDEFVEKYCLNCRYKPKRHDTCGWRCQAQITKDARKILLMRCGDLTELTLRSDEEIAEALRIQGAK